MSRPVDRAAELTAWVWHAMRFIDLAEADPAGYLDQGLMADAARLTTDGYALFGVPIDGPESSLATLKTSELLAFTQPDGTFEWALSQLRSGRKVRRKSWGEGEWIELCKGTLHDEDGAPTSFTGSITNLALATDWELFDVAVKP